MNRQSSNNAATATPVLAKSVDSFLPALPQSLSAASDDQLEIAFLKSETWADPTRQRRAFAGLGLDGLDAWSGGLGECGGGMRDVSRADDTHHADTRDPSCIYTAPCDNSSRTRATADDCGPTGTRAGTVANLRFESLDSFNPLIMSALPFIREEGDHDGDEDSSHYRGDAFYGCGGSDDDSPNGAGPSGCRGGSMLRGLAASGPRPPVRSASLPRRLFASAAGMPLLPQRDSSDNNPSAAALVPVHERNDPHIQMHTTHQPQRPRQVARFPLPGRLSTSHAIPDLSSSAAIERLVAGGTSHQSNSPLFESPSTPSSSPPSSLSTFSTDSPLSFSYSPSDFAPAKRSKASPMSPLRADIGERLWASSGRVLLARSVNGIAGVSALKRDRAGDSVGSVGLVAAQRADLPQRPGAGSGPLQASADPAVSPTSFVLPTPPPLAALRNLSQASETLTDPSNDNQHRQSTSPLDLTSPSSITSSTSFPSGSSFIALNDSSRVWSTPDVPTESALNASPPRPHRKESTVSSQQAPLDCSGSGSGITPASSHTLGSIATDGAQAFISDRAAFSPSSSSSPLSPSTSKPLHTPTLIATTTSTFLTTTSSGTILTVAQPPAFLSLFGYEPEEVLGMSVYRCFWTGYGDRAERVVRARVGKDGQDDEVLVNGKVVRIHRADGSSAPASLWLKEKWVRAAPLGGAVDPLVMTETDTPQDLENQVKEDRQRVYVWMFQPVEEVDCVIAVRRDGVITSSSLSSLAFFGVPSSDLIGRTLWSLVPALASSSATPSAVAPSLDPAVIRRDKFFCGLDASGEAFPCVVRVVEEGERQLGRRGTREEEEDVVELRMHAMPYVAGLVSVRPFDPEDSNERTDISTVAAQAPTSSAPAPMMTLGSIASLNRSIAKYMLGLSRAHVESLGTVAVERLFPSFREIVQIPDGDTKRVEAVHRDGTKILVDVRVRRVREARGDLWALWITYRRRNLHKGVAPTSSWSTFNVSSLRSPLAVSDHAPGAIGGSVLSNSTAHHPARSAVLMKSNLGHVAMVKLREVASVSATRMKLGEESLNRGLEGVEGRADGVIDDVNVASDKGIRQHGSELTIESEMNTVQGFNSERSLASHTETVTPTASNLGLETASIAPLAPTLKHARIGLAKYVVGERLGSPGAFGFVRKAYLKGDPTRTPYVIKHCLRSSIALSRYSSDPDLGMVPTEILVLHKIRQDPRRSPYVAHLVDFFSDDQYFYVVMPCLGSADLFDYVEMYLGKGSNRIPEEIVQHIFKQVVDGVAYLHANGIVHRDIKDENVIISDSLDVTIVDFGSAAFYKPGVVFKTFCGTLDYAAPEVLEGNSYRGPEQDVWALGILFYILLFSENPFRDVAEITAKEIRYPYAVSDSAFELLNLMLLRDPSKRPTTGEVTKHKFFSGLDYKEQPR
ncbi:hypothetical protein HDU93_003559 [Gonapodya sp. JEL0774]|nr:hypothetical protein HDU93_003559 [Gonapodya sp. JEL0774]